MACPDLVLIFLTLPVGLKKVRCKIIWFKRNVVLKNLGRKKKNCQRNVLTLKNLGQNQIWSNIMFGLKKFGPKYFFLTRLPKIWSKKFGQNQVRNSSDIADTDKCCQDICCLDKCHHGSWHLLKMVPGS